MSENPKSVAIVAMGRSMATYMGFCVTHGSRSKVADEVWTINSASCAMFHDRAFVMDDLRSDLEIKAADQPDGMAAGMLSYLKTASGPIYTSRAYPDEYPGTVDYPLEEVFNAVNPPYLNTSVAYAFAYAMYLKIPKVALYGCDFHYNEPEMQHVREAGRACLEFLMGMAAQRGVQLVVASDSTLMDAEIPADRKFYGYARPVKIVQDEGGVWRVSYGEADKRVDPPLKAAAGASGLRLTGGES